MTGTIKMFFMVLEAKFRIKVAKDSVSAAGPLAGPLTVSCGGEVEGSLGHHP